MTSLENREEGTRTTPGLPWERWLWRGQRMDSHKGQMKYTARSSSLKMAPPSHGLILLNKYVWFYVELATTQDYMQVTVFGSVLPLGQ